MMLARSLLTRTRIVAARLRHDSLRNLSSFSYNDNRQHSSANTQSKWITFSSILVAGGFAYGLKKSVEALQTDADCPAGVEIDSLPTYTLEEVSKHSNPDESVWVVFKAGVYDVTKFVKIHPGGNYVLLAAGNSIEPFWQVYGQHKTKQVYELLETFRVGNLRQEDRLTADDLRNQVDSMEYIPLRNEKLIKYHDKPFNAETPLSDLIENFLTPNNDFFIRNHLGVPEVDPASYELEIEGLGVEGTKVLTLEQLKTLFPRHSVTSVVQCAGNRRESFNAIKEVKGIPWAGGAIGNARWTGVKLVDVLRHCGADLSDVRIKHVVFDGLDLDATATPYGASVPADKALDPMSQFLVAFEMNGEPIPADHGYPVRLIAPGIVGARNVKWLGKITLSETESESHWQRRDYKSFPADVNSATAEEFDTAHAIQELPIQSAICTPGAQEKVKIQWKPSPSGDTMTPYIEVKGYAWSGGGRSVIRVDLSTDDGKSWFSCDLNKAEEETGPSHTYSWVLWRREIPLKSDELWQGRQIEVVCRAWDSAYNTQPRDPAEIWNFRGLLNNSWHRVRFVTE